MEKVSVIVPIYNEEENLRKCIDSLINQSYKELEIILLNDGSTDNSQAIMESYKDERIIAINKENSGIADTRNQGLDIASGDYIMFLDSDDYLELDCIEKCMERFKEDNSDIVMFEYFLDMPSKTIEIKLPQIKTISIKEDKDFLTKISLGPCTKIFKRELIKDNQNYFPLNLKYEDVPVVVEAVTQAKKISCLNIALYHYVIKRTGETITRDERLFDILKICEIVNKKLENNPYVAKTNLIVKILSYYLKNSRYIPDKVLQRNFIKAIYKYLDSLDKNWRKCTFLKEEGLVKGFIIKNQWVLKLANILKK